MSDWHREETYKSLIQIGNTALKFVLIANGGAVIAILAFLGKVHGTNTPISGISCSLAVFLLGVFLGGLACVTGYLTQLILYNEPTDKSDLKLFKRHETWLCISIFLVFIGVISFGIGSWLGLKALV